jgi:hypothetical protein
MPSWLFRALRKLRNTAVADWIARPELPRAALLRLAEIFRQRHGDLWWSQFLAAPATPEALRALSAARRAYTAGRYAEAGAAAARAEAEFSRLGNSPGRRWAQWESISASLRGDDQNRCGVLLAGFGESAAALSYRWLAGQSRLDDITCRSLFRRPSLTDRAQAFETAGKSGFEALSLRALAFLTEPPVGAESPARVWNWGFEGLARARLSLVSTYRIHHFCWSLAELGRIAGYHHASVFLAREREILDSERDSYLAALEAEAGHKEAAERLIARHRPSSQAIANRYRYEQQIDWAQAELGVGNAGAAAQRLSTIASPDREKLDLLDRSDLLNTEGKALLRLGKYDEAAARFEQSISLNRPILSSSSRSDVLERSSVARFYGKAIVDSVKPGSAWGVPRGRRSPHGVDSAMCGLPFPGL